MQTNITHPQLSVLIIEDETLIAEELQERLLHLGHRVIGVADSAEEGVRLAIRERPTLVLVDIRLKGKKDGTTAVTEIHQQLDLPTIYITAHSDLPTFNRVKETEYDGLILKPFHGKELRSTIETALWRYTLRAKYESNGSGSLNGCGLVQQ
jgi:DNA-binding response OmpR family regulator